LPALVTSSQHHQTAPQLQLLQQRQGPAQIQAAATVLRRLQGLLQVLQLLSSLLVLVVGSKLHSRVLPS
jgi:hypothetical protein